MSEHSVSPAMSEMQAALDAVQSAQAALDAARERRDVAVVRLHTEDEMRPPQIERATGMSRTNVRAILRVHLARTGTS